MKSSASELATVRSAVAVEDISGVLSSVLVGALALLEYADLMALVCRVRRWNVLSLRGAAQRRRPAPRSVGAEREGLAVTIERNERVTTHARFDWRRWTVPLG
jgi:hypothetical protein